MNRVKRNLISVVISIGLFGMFFDSLVDWIEGYVPLIKLGLEG